MKKLIKVMRGVTLLEVMLVLAIAAMIIVMSVRYYQSATSNQQANAVMGQVQAIVAAADQLAQATGSYQGNLGDLPSLLPQNGLQTPWGQAITVTATGTSTYTIQIDAVPVGVCPLVRSKLLANAHFSTGDNCTGSVGNLTFTYTANV